MANLHIFTFNLFQEHTMILESGNSECVVVDPGFYDEKERKEFHDAVAAKGLKPCAVLITHGHLDHVWGVKDVQDTYGVPVYMNPADKILFDHDAVVSRKLGLTPPDYGFDITPVADGDVVKAAGFSFEVITTPGHTPGGVCWLERGEKMMFTGDTLFAGTIGRTDLKYGEYDDLIVSIMEKLMWLDTDIVICPGHGGRSDIGRERTHNPMLEPFNEPEPESAM